MKLSPKQLADGLLSLTTSLSSTGPYVDRMTQICRATVDLLDCDRSSIFLVEDGYYRARFNWGNPPDIARQFQKFRVRLDDPLISRAVEARTFHIENNVLDSKLMNPQTAREARISSIVVAPLLDDELRGFMTAEYNERLGSFDETDATLLDGFSRLGALTVASEQRRIEAERLENELRQAQKVDAIGQLASGVAHDFNNQLFVIRGHVELLAKRIPAPLAASLRVIQTAIERSTDLTRQLLLFSRKQVLQERALALATEVKRQAGMLKRAIRDNIELRIACDASSDRVLLDQGQLTQMLVNLVLNSRDAMPNGGTVTVSTSTADGQAVLSVSDTGIGMDEETRNRALEPFFTTKAPGEGTGLGLSTVAAIARRHGGDVEITSQVGEGTTVRVFLPHSDEPADSVVASASPPPRGAGLILLVEDEQALREVLSDVLLDHGYEVTACADGVEASEKAVELGTDFDLLVTDVVMPRKQGPELAKELRQSRPTLKTIFLSGYPDEALAPAELDASSILLHKPCDANLLLWTIHELIGDRQANEEA